jgi:outer membrane PBP1 activator LpoA protein
MKASTQSLPLAWPRAAQGRFAPRHGAGWLLLLVLCGCASYPPARFPGTPGGAPATADTAEAAARRGDHAQAAPQYEATAARATGAGQVDLRLRAAREWLLAGRAGETSRILAGLRVPPSPPLSAEQNVTARVLDAEVSLAAGQGQQAWEKIAAIPEPAGSGAPAYLDARMRIAFAAARPVDAVRAEISAEKVQSSAAGRTQLRNQLLTLLRQARERGVKLDAAASQDATIRGWLDLGSMMGSNRGASLTGSGGASQWRARYPDHPAAELINEALPPSLAATGSINRIALLLPLTASPEARIIRDGFQFAITQIPAATRPEIKVYDTSTTSPVAALSTARTDGNDFVIGPLLKTEVAAAAANGTPAVPVLALNFLPNESEAGPNGFYQFALSPEDEARATAKRVLASGARRGVALAPAGDWGGRVTNAFMQEFQAGGGMLVSQATYDDKTTDFSTPIKVALNTTDSEARLRRLQVVTGAKFEFEPRRRSDIQFIFAAASSPTAARLLRPQLGFQYAGDLPTYMTSDAFTPDAREANQDLNGILFPDMPWRLPDSSLDGMRVTAEQSGASGSWHTKYFAFGYDACQLALAIAGSGRNPQRVLVSGLSGVLRIDAGGHVRRELLWSRINDGSAQLLLADATTQ